MTGCTRRACLMAAPVTCCARRACLMAAPVTGGAWNKPSLHRSTSHWIVGFNIYKRRHVGMMQMQGCAMPAMQSCSCAESGHAAQHAATRTSGGHIMVRPGSDGTSYSSCTWHLHHTNPRWRTRTCRLRAVSRVTSLHEELVSRNAAMRRRAATHPARKHEKGGPAL